MKGKTNLGMIAKIRPFASKLGLSASQKFNRYHLIAVAILMAGVGGFILYRSLAATVSATKVWDTNADWSTGTLTRAAIANNSVSLPSATPATTNLSLHKLASASSVLSNCTLAANAFDAISTTSWTSQASDSQWVRVDLGAAYPINRVTLNWAAAYARAYKVQVSNDATNWTDVYSTTTGATGTNDITGLAASGRYVQMLGIIRGTTAGYSLIGMNVFGPSTRPSANPIVSLYKPAAASSVLSSCTAAANAFDNSSTTGWTSQASDSQWLRVDLGVAYTIKEVKLNWGTAYAKSYKVQVSSDATNWTDVYSTTAGTTGIKDITGLAASGRYVRMLGLTRGTTAGYTLLGMHVYGSYSGSISLSYDAGANVDWTTLTPVATLPGGTNITYQARTSADNATWSTWNSDITQAANSRYIQIQATLSTTNTATPSLDKLTLGYDSTDTTAPSITISSPANGATISGTRVVTVNASDDVGIVKVEYYRNGVLVFTTTTPPFDYSWDTTTSPNASYTLTAKAYDAAGNSSSSAPVTVTVNNSSSSSYRNTVMAQKLTTKPTTT